MKTCPGLANVIITIEVTIDPGAHGRFIANQGSFSFDSDLNGSNETTGVTDDPNAPGSANPTSFTVAFAFDSAIKTVTGSFTPGGAVTYTIVITNSGDTLSADDPGDELTDILPPALTLVSASASSGLALATVGTNTVTRNGSVSSGGSVTVTIAATINPGTMNAVVSNQAVLRFDADGDGSNETSALSDDPSQPGGSDPTVFALDATAIPTTSALGLLIMVLAIAAAAWRTMR